MAEEFKIHSNAITALFSVILHIRIVLVILGAAGELSFQFSYFSSQGCKFLPLTSLLGTVHRCDILISADLKLKLLREPSEVIHDFLGL